MAGNEGVLPRAGWAGHGPPEAAAALDAMTTTPFVRPTTGEESEERLPTFVDLRRFPPCIYPFYVHEWQEWGLKNAVSLLN